MMVRKAVAGSVLGVVLTAIAISGAGSAFAEGGHGAPGTPGSTETTNINSFNTKTVTVTKDDHSVNLALFSGNTVTLRVFNNNFNNNKLFSGNRVPILNGNKLFSGNRFPIITPPPA